MRVAPSSSPVVRSNVRKLYAAGPFGSAGTAGRPSAGLPHTIRLGKGGGVKHVHPALVNRAAVTPPSAATGATSTRVVASTAITNNGNRNNGPPIARLRPKRQVLSRLLQLKRIPLWG